MKKEPIIKAENLTFSYPGDAESKPVRALDNVSFEIEEGRSRPFSDTMEAENPPLPS